ncbi:MAG: N-acetylglucosamine kinase [Flammeovirgaceae bacterium]
MELIVDSGSTKADWRMLAPDGIQQFRTKGLNPYYVSPTAITQILRGTTMPETHTDVQQIYFYGAGCKAKAQQQKIIDGLTPIFPQATIEVHGDMLGAARAVCGQSAGIVGILGTGSNSCLYREQKIAMNSPSNGIWLGDEGSAGYLGKQLIIDYLNHELPLPIRAQFEKRFTDRRDEIIHQVYKAPFPNTYLASFSRFIYHHLTEPYFVHLVYQAFENFFNKTILKYPDYQNFPVHFVGSVAFHFKPLLTQVAQDLGIAIRSIVTAPIDGLVKYHQKFG